MDGRLPAWKAGLGLSWTSFFAGFGIRGRGGRGLDRELRRAVGEFRQH